MTTTKKKARKPTKAALCRRSKFFKKLSKYQIEHLLVTTDALAKLPTLKAFKENRAHQLANSITCHDCRSIALTLGLEK